jgi:hypothetical protein
MRERSPRSHGSLLRPVHGGLTTGIGRRARRCMAHSRYGGRELAAETPRERGDRREPHHGVGGRRGGAAWPGDGGLRQRRKFLDGAVAWRTENGSWGRDWMQWRDGVLLVALYRAGRLAGAAGERSWWRPVEFNGVAVLSLESAQRGRGNGGAAPLRKRKWRWRGLGRGGGTRHDGSRTDRRRWLGREVEDGRAH